MPVLDAFSAIFIPLHFLQWLKLLSCNPVLWNGCASWTLQFSIPSHFNVSLIAERWCQKRALSRATMLPFLGFGFRGVSAGWEWAVWDVLPDLFGAEGSQLRPGVTEMFPAHIHIMSAHQLWPQHHSPLECAAKQLHSCQLGKSTSALSPSPWFFLPEHVQCKNQLLENSIRKKSV